MDKLKITMIAASLNCMFYASSIESLPPMFAIKSNQTNTNFFKQSSTNVKNGYNLDALRSNKIKLHSFLNLGINWNGYEGQTFDKNLIEKVEKIISGLDYQPQIFPTGRGSIQLDNFIDDENFTEIEISNEEIFVYQMKKGQEVEVVTTENKINDFISEIYG